jgi:hypothetical protein
MQPLRIHDVAPREPRLIIAAGAEWFQLGDQPVVTLETRMPLRRLLLALAELKKRSPGAVLPVTAAFEAGWPGERASPTAAAMRVYTAIHSLRRLGLRGLLVRRRRGYVLDALVTVTTHQSQIPPRMSDEEQAAADAEAPDSTLARAGDAGDEIARAG